MSVENCTMQLYESYTWCSEGVHNHGEVEPKCKADHKSQYIAVMVTVCQGGNPQEPGMEVPIDYGSGESGGALPCSANGVYLSPQDPAQSGCNGGVVTLPNLSAEYIKFNKVISELSTELQSFFYQPNNIEIRDYLMDYFITNSQSLDAGNFVKWSINFLYQNQNVTWVQFQNWFIDGNLDFQNIADVEFAKDLSILSNDLVFANQNGTLNQLQASWPNWEKVKQKIKNSIAQGVHQTAKIVKTYYDEVTSNPYTNNAATRVVLNVYIDALRNEIKQITNMNKDTMNWQDLYNIWLFELMPNPYSSINFTWNSNVINGNTLYNANTNAVYKFPKGSPDMMNDIKNGLSNGTFNVGNSMSRYFHYNFTQYYATLSNNNIGIQMLGSYPIKATVVSKSGNSAVVRFYIFNTLGWESATRFVQTGDGTIGVIPNKEIGEGIHLGGNLENTYTWEEIIMF